MQFKHPEILYALFALLIPILVHLFQLRRFQQLPFTNVQFLKAVTLQTRKSAQLKKWLTLLARLVALAALIMAFAQPFFASKAALVTASETIIYLDNSFSMEAQGAKGPLFKRAVQEVLSSIPDDEEITIFTNDKVYKNTTTKDSQASLSSDGYSTNQLSYPSVLLKAKQLFSKTEASAKRIIMVSDFQQKETPFVMTPDSTTVVDLIQVQPVSKQNLAIDSLYLSKNSTDEFVLHVQLQNYGSEAMETPVALYNRDHLIAKTSIRLAPHMEMTTSFALQADKNFEGEVRIEDANLQFDNSKYFNINSPEKIKVLSINDADASFLQHIFTPKEFVLENTAFDQLDYNKIANANCIIINELKTLPVSLQNALRNFAENGGVICMIPSENANSESYTQFLSAYGTTFQPVEEADKKITTIHFSHPLYQGVFDKKVTNFQYPSVKRFFPSLGGKPVLSYEDDTPFLIAMDNLYVFTAAINSKNSNFKNAPLIVPTLYNIGKLSLKLPALYYTIGHKNSYAIATQLGQDEILSLVKDTEKTIPQQQSYTTKVVITTTASPDLAGVYQVQRGDSRIAQATYNYDTVESNLSYQDVRLLAPAAAPSLALLLEDIKASRTINKLWKWFVIFALLFLVIELLLLKFLK